jgi:copper transport protein
LLLIAQLLAAAPASAHAELVSSSPAAGARLARPPAEVVLRFTEGVGLVDGGFRLLDDSGALVATPAEPVSADSTVRWPMPPDLPVGRYLVSWRVVSDDGHPVAGAFSFGIGVTPETTTATATEDTNSFSWPVALAKFGGYLGFVLLLGAVVVAAAVWPAARRQRGVQSVLRVGAVFAVVSTLAALLLQGPYAAGEPLTRLFDRTLLAETASTSFGAWTQLRVFLLLAVIPLTWPRAALESAFNRAASLVCLAAVAVSFSGTGHAAAGGIGERVVDTVHVAAAGVWVGGLVVLAAASVPPALGPDALAWARFSRLALRAVVLLVATGVLNSVLRLSSVDDLWQTGYGRVLATKILLVMAALAGGALSRRALRRGADPTRTVPLEAVATVAVVAITAVLGTMAPPPALATTSGGTPTSEASEVVSIDLGSGRSAHVHIDPATTAGSTLHLELRGSSGVPATARSAELTATLAARDLGPLDIPLRERAGGGWNGRFSFPFPGTWKLTLTVENPAWGALVSAETVVIR